MSTVLDRLRSETRQLHEAIEQAVPILRPGAALCDYRRYLEKLFGYHRPLEKAVQRVLASDDLQLQLDERRKVPHLERDLLALGLSSAAIAELPLCGDTPDIGDVPSALGALYVLEGATLGAKLCTARCIKDFLTPWPSRPHICAVMDRTPA